MTNIPKTPNLIQQVGFTLIELSIVLVIIGLIVGGVLTGQDLIKAAEIRATVGQYEKYNTAVNTFRTKYNGIPGDLLAASSTAFGLDPIAGAHAGTTGLGDGNGLITDNGSINYNAPVGEPLLIWQQLSAASLIDGSVGTAVATTGTAVTPFTISSYLPTAKMGRGNYWVAGSNAGLNYLALAGIATLSSTAYTSTPGGAMSPIDAFNIDTKLDDGMPNTGIVVAVDATSWSTTADTIFNVSGGVAYPKWTTSTAASGDCVTGTSATAAADTYNRAGAFGTVPACSLRLRFN